VSVYSIAGQQSNMFQCFNDTVGCSIPGFIIIYCVSGIGNVMSVVLPAATCLLILGSLGAIIIAQWTQWIPDSTIWNDSVCIPTREYWQQSFWN